MSDIAKKELKKGILRLAGALLALLAALGLLYAGYRVIMSRIEEAQQAVFNGTVSQGEIDLTPDEIMEYNEIDFQQAVLGEATRKKELVVLEREAKTETVITNALANIEIFRKSKTIHTYGTGVYTVDLAEIAEGDITMDADAKTITIQLPLPVLKYVTIDPEKTEVEEVDRASFLAFGDIKLTAEQQQMVDKAISDELRMELENHDALLMADTAALQSAIEIFQPVVSAVAEEFTVIAEMPERPEEADPGPPSQSESAIDTAG